MTFNIIVDDRLVFTSNNQIWWYSSLRHEFGNSEDFTSCENDVVMDNTVVVSKLSTSISSAGQVWSEFEEDLKNQFFIGYVVFATVFARKNDPYCKASLVLVATDRPLLKKVFFLPCSSGDNRFRVAVNKRLSEVKTKHGCRSNVELENGGIAVANIPTCKVLTLLHVESWISALKKEQRTNAWKNRLNGLATKPKISRKYRGAASTIQLSDALSRRAQECLDDPKSSIMVCDLYRGGKYHTPICEAMKATSEGNVVAEVHFKRSTPLPDFIVSKDPSFFHREVDVKDILRAINNTKIFIEQNLNVDKEDVAGTLGLLSSNLFEDIEWRLKDPTGLESAQLKSLVVDIDQVIIINFDFVHIIIVTLFLYRLSCMRTD